MRKKKNRPATTPFASQHIHPAYESRFACAGPNCEDTCCACWTVPIDKASYEKYQLIPASALRTKVEQHLVLTPEKNSDLHFARVQHDSTGACPFLEDSLCGFQKHHGPEYLSHTCSTYPRGLKQVDQTIEKTLLLSCPEAARLVLLDPNLVPDLSSAPAGQLRYQRFAELVNEPARPSELPMVYLWEIRSFALLLIRDRSYPLWQRLFVLGMFCKRLDALVAEKQITALPRLLKDYGEITASRILRPTMDAIPAQPALQLDLILTLLKNRLEGEPVNRRLLSCVSEFSRGIGFDPQSSPAALVERYVAASSEYYREWFRQNELIFENYLTNYIFAHLFPFGSPGPEQGQHAWREYLLACVQFAVINSLLIGVAGHHREAFNTGHALTLIQSFSKDIEHSRIAVDQIVSFFEASQFNNTNGIAALLRELPSVGSIAVHGQVSTAGPISAQPMAFALQA